ncbi:head maturation protease, ClpP-related [Phocaeicola faecicola]|uniref:head maturation protease, ClpP-related n=1 Tax=Phocaeicola faecicola TaxID=2739389 RepID=UPI002A807BB8|nr:head maturation protease, ClpP-related [Phocaeicola faecicola]MDY4872618.1 Clp protease ClpP [Phocaeicola faecicola]
MAKNSFFKNQINADGSVRILLYGDIGFGDKVDSGRVVAEVMKLAAAYNRMEVHINSRGGDVFSGMAIYNALRECNADISIHVDGVAASIASVVALCGKPLYMNRYSRLMIHRVSSGGWGNAEDLRKQADLCEQLENDIATMIAAKCGKTADDIKAQYFDGKDHWINATQAMDLKMIDGITGDDAAASQLSENSTTDSIYNFFTNRLESEAQNQREMALIDELKKRSGFANMATEQEMLQHITTLENQAAKVPAMEARVTELTNQITAMQKTAHEAFLNQAVAEGRLTKEQVPVFLNLMASDEKNTRAAIEALPKRTASVNAYLTGDNPGGAANDLMQMSWDEIDKAERLAELKNNYPDLYKKKYNERFKTNY